ncbi:MAG: DUF3147 family protein [Ktedonobacterales bacterium]
MSANMFLPSQRSGSSDHHDTPSPGARDVSRPRVDFSRLSQIHVKDYAMRFAFGGTISVLAALLGQWVTPRFGGVFTAFPAILLASLTLIGKEDGREESAEDAEGGVLGAIAFVAIAAFIAATLAYLSGAASLFLALLIWLVVAVGLYLLCIKLGLLRTFEEKKDEPGEGARAKPQQDM